MRRETRFIKQPKILTSSNDPNSALWKKCQPIVPDREVELDLKLRVLENCHVYVEVEGMGAFPTMITEIATAKSKFTEAQVDAMIKEGEKDEIDLLGTR